MQIISSGRGELNTLSLPNISCQPGFSGFFDFGDLPAGEKNDKGSKTFILELRPISTLVTSIPSIEFSSFDPVDKQYHLQRSQAIPIVVTQLQTENIEKIKAFQKQERLHEDQEDTVSDWNKILSAPPQSEISSNILIKPETSWMLWLESWNTLLLVPFGLLFFLIIWGLKMLWNEYLRKSSIKTSDDYLHEGIRTKNWNLIEEALFLGLKEKGKISPEMKDIEDLPQEGISGKIRSFINEIDSARFGETKEKSLESLLKDAKKWYSQIMHGENI